MSSTPILAENTKSHSHDFNSATEAYRLLQDKREIEAAKLNNVVINAEVSRDSVYEDLLKIYKKGNVTSHKLHITFKGEQCDKTILHHPRFEILKKSLESNDSQLGCLQ